MSAATTTISERLKTETAEHHRRAEGKAIQQALVRGQVTREQYGAWLSQMRHVHGALERAIDGAAPRDPRLAITLAQQTHSHRIGEDLAFLGLAGAGALSATASLMDAISRADGPSLIGMHYVLEGSMNGGKYIAMGVRRGLGLAAGAGDRYLDPYGDQQRAVWATFKQGLDSASFTPGEAERVLDGARAMFDGIANLSDGLA